MIKSLFVLEPGSCYQYHENTLCMKCLPPYASKPWLTTLNSEREYTLCYLISTQKKRTLTIQSWLDCTTFWVLEKSKSVCFLLELSVGRVWDTFVMKGYFQLLWKRNIMCNEFLSIHLHIGCGSQIIQIVMKISRSVFSILDTVTQFFDISKILQFHCILCLCNDSSSFPAINRGLPH